MISVHPSQVPQFLSVGEFYKALDLSNDDQIQVPTDVLKADKVVRNNQDLEHLLSSLRYWGIYKLPSEAINYILFNKNVTKVDPKYDISFPLLVLLRTLHRCSNPGERFRLAIQSGSIRVLKSLVQRGIKPQDDSSRSAVKFGQVHVLQYLHTLGAKIDILTCKMAFATGHINCLDYLRTEGFLTLVAGKFITLIDSLKNSADYMYVHPTLELVTYAVQQGCVMNSVTMSSATRQGKLDIMKYARENGCSWDAATPQSAAEGDHLQCLEYAHTHGCEWTSTTTTAAAGMSIACLRYAIEHNCSYNGHIIQSASAYNNIDCLAYLHSIGCQFGEQDAIVCAEKGLLECLQYLFTHDCPITGNALTAAKKRMNTQCTAYLEKIGICVE